MEVSRRAFLAGAGAAAVATVAPKGDAHAAISPDSYATLIDLTKCDGCPGKDTPVCVSSCRSVNSDKFPEPDPKMLKDYWPQPKHEDWSKKRHLTNRLTPYNWIFVQRTKVEHEGQEVAINIPRRCMHCDSPACSKICPFGVNRKNKDGTVTIDPFLCFGGAKCRTVCPWSVPQRQAGVGVYTLIDPVPAGGGVMFKCDLCRDRLQKGQKPGCVEGCPQKAMEIGARGDIYARASKLAAEVDGDVYGMQENGGTSTLYVSRVPFEKINQSLLAAAKDPKKVMQMHKPKNMLEKVSGFSWAALVAPVVGIAAAFMGGVKTADNKEDK